MITFYKAMILARDDPEFNGLYQSIKGLVFLGTPHRGISPLATTFLGSLQLSGKLSMVSINYQFLKNLKADSDLLHDISSRFAYCLADVEIISFYEQLATSRIGLLVPVSIAHIMI